MCNQDKESGGSYSSLNNKKEVMEDHLDLIRRTVLTMTNKENGYFMQVPLSNLLYMNTLGQGPLKILVTFNLTPYINYTLGGLCKEKFEGFMVDTNIADIPFFITKKDNVTIQFNIHDKI